MFVDAIRQQRFKIRMPLSCQSAKNPARPGVCRAIQAQRRGAQKTITISAPKFVARSRLDRSRTAIFAFTVSIIPDQHEVDQLRNIHPIFDGSIGIAIRTHILPRGTIRWLRCADDEIVTGIVIAAHIDIVIGFASEIISEKGILKSLVRIVLSPIHAVDVDVHKASMRIETAHVEHGVFYKSIRHVKATIDHIVISGCNAEGINLIGRRNAAVKATEQREIETFLTIDRSETQTVTFFRKIRPRAPYAIDSRIDLHRW